MQTTHCKHLLILFLKVALVFIQVICMRPKLGFFSCFIIFFVLFVTERGLCSQTSSVAAFAQVNKWKRLFSGISSQPNTTGCIQALSSFLC